MDQEKIIFFKTLVTRIPLSRTTIWRLERAGKFPQRRLITNGRVGWLESEVSAWIAGRRAEIKETPEQKKRA